VPDCTAVSRLVKLACTACSPTTAVSSAASTVSAVAAGVFLCLFLRVCLAALDHAWVQSHESENWQGEG
jgi:hypothetical protein